MYRHSRGYAAPTNVLTGLGSPTPLQRGASTLSLRFIRHSKRQKDSSCATRQQKSKDKRYGDDVYQRTTNRNINSYAKVLFFRKWEMVLSAINLTFKTHKIYCKTYYLSKVKPQNPFSN